MIRLLPNEMLTDFKHALRLLIKAPAFALVAARRATRVDPITTLRSE